MNPIQSYEKYKIFFGDLHNHCAISYGHGSLEQALANAREQLDFCSITGHAHWPDMPEPDERIQYIIDFHKEGFAKLKKNWKSVLAALRQADEAGRFVVFPGFEIHFNSVGDRTVCYREIEGEILYAKDFKDLQARLRALNERGEATLSFPHHIGYRKGTRGIDWSRFHSDLEPLVEIYSMHGCSEASENPRPFLHSMGPSDWESTMQYGLAQGHVFGVCANTDHHSAHPGSYGHGKTGVWAESLTRKSIWEALNARRTYALTGDRMALGFSINGEPMGSILEAAGAKRKIEIDLRAGGALDYIDLVKNNRLLRRFSETDVKRPSEIPETVRTKLFLELGWGEKNKATDWEVCLGISEGEILSVEPRFRGMEVVTPVDDPNARSAPTSHWEMDGERAVRLTTRTFGHPNTSTNTAQGICLDIVAPRGAKVQATLNGVRESLPLERLIEGARTGHLGKIDSPAYRFNRAPLPWETEWSFSLEDEGGEADFYYLRARQKNDQWGWSSPLFFR